MVKLSDQDRARVVGYVQSGRTGLYVAGLFHVHPNTIGNLMRHWRQTGEVKDLRRYLQDVWDAVTPERIARLIRSRCRRCVACIAARGGHTRY